jgi:allantoicase
MKIFLRALLQKQKKGRQRFCGYRITLNNRPAYHCGITVVPDGGIKTNWTENNINGGNA